MGIEASQIRSSGRNACCESNLILPSAANIGLFVAYLDLTCYLRAQFSEIADEVAVSYRIAAGSRMPVGS